MIAKYHLAALCLQTNRRNEGVELAREIGFRYVIQSDIWQTSGLMGSSGESFVGAVDLFYPVRDSTVCTKFSHQTHHFGVNIPIQLRISFRTMSVSKIRKEICSPTLYEIT